ncbi:MAG: PAS domain S-box protein [Ignavibacteriaceae bacterium]|jgi:PAS domain S-box-containing protein|nr:PAS domain S-box protein [Ignavibacteriaceae bacterium]
MSDLFIKNNPQPIYIYDKESLRFLDINDAALKLYGYELDEFLQMDVTDLYTSEDIQSLLEFSQDIFKDGEFSKPFKQRKKDGSYIHVRISRINYQHEDTEAYLNILEDVSASFETEKKNQIFKAAFDNTNDMIFITDPDGTITYVNDSVSKTLGVSSTDLINTDITLNCGEEDKVFINDSVFHSHIKETVTFTIELITSEGRLLECDIVSTPVFDSSNRLESFVILAKPNIIPKVSNKKIEKEANENHHDKTQKVGEKDSGDTIISSSFLSGAFHEILTPMNVILGFTQELMESIETPSPEQKEAIDIINQNRVLILSLMNTIIEFSDIQFNKQEIELSEVAVTEVIENYEKSLNEITGIRDLEFAYGKISSSLRFNIDKKKFLNLLSNLFRLVGRISSQKKLFFSAYQVEDNSFNISISDAFGKSTSQLVETLKSLLLDKKEPKVFGLSKLTIQIINKLLETLEGQFVILNENTEKQDIGFRFPVNIVQIQEEPEIKETEKVVPMQTEIQLQQPIPEEDPQLLNISDEIEIVEEDLSHINNKNESEAKSETKEQETIVEEIKAEPEKLVIGNNKVVPEEKPAAPKSSNGLSSLRCLYIEDQVDSQILFKVQMKDLKNIQFATSFEEALPLLESNEFDFIIMDINLQGEYNGLDALKVIHQIPQFQKIPVIAVTAYVLPGDREKFIATGFTDFISKPIFREKLVESLKKIFVN